MLWYWCICRPPPHWKTYLPFIIVLLLLPPATLFSLPALYWSYMSNKNRRLRRYHLAWKYYNRVYYFAMFSYISLVGVLIWACSAFISKAQPFQSFSRDPTTPPDRLTDRPEGPSIQFLEQNNLVEKLMLLKLSDNSGREEKAAVTEFGNLTTVKMAPTAALFR